MIGLSSNETGFALLAVLLSGALVWQTVKLRRLKKTMEKKTDQLHRRLHTKGRMIITLSHEVLTPLRMISTVARRELPNVLLPDNVRTGLEKIARTADMLYHTSLNIVTWMKYHANDQALAKELVIPSEVARRAIELMSYMAETKQVRILNMIPAHIRLYTDRTLLQIVLLNLLSNALKYSTAGEVAFHGWERDRKVYLAVYDTGTGFREDVLQQLRFHAGRHLSAAGAYGEPGHGVGYTIILQFLQQLGGALEIENRPGKGATVTVILPGE